MGFVVVTLRFDKQHALESLRSGLVHVRLPATFFSSVVGQ